jgi:superfamily II DNA or RNA helicase
VTVGGLSLFRPPASPAEKVTLRPYQVEARSAVAAVWEDADAGNPLIVLPTGCGKTRTALSIVEDELDAGGRVVWLAHRGELLTQPLAALRKTRPDLARHAGIVKAGQDEADRRLVFASIPTVAKKARRARILAHGEPSLVVVDEAHHSVAKGQRRAIAGLRGGRLLGLTATPDRADGKDLAELWQIAYSYPITRAISEGYLVPPYSVVCPVPDLDPGDLLGLSDEEQGEALIAAHIVEHTVETLSAPRHAVRLPDREASALLETRGRRWLVFTASIRQAELTAEALTAAGWRARWASGDTSADDRARLLRALAEQKIDVLVSPAIFTEGTDCPPVDGILLARACASWSLLVQCVGRGLRLSTATGKAECMVIDLAGATEVHDLRSAPVLIGGSRCPEDPRGVHEFGELDNGRGLCGKCNKQIACFAALEQDETTHRWIDGERRKCGHCGRPQCEASEDGRHAWEAIETEGIQACLACGIEIRLRDGTLKRRAREDRCGETRDGVHVWDGATCSACGASAETHPGAWVRLPAVSPETWAINIDAHGLVFVQVQRATGTGVPIWLKRGGRKPRRLRAACPLAHVRAEVDYLVRRAEKTASKASGWRDKRPSRRALEHLQERLLGLSGRPRWAEPSWQAFRDADRAGAIANEITRLKARERAIAIGICEEKG